MRHDLTTLELLLAVARTRSITRGAEQVHLALAAASKRISDLEARLGIRLFLRQARGVEATEACQSLLRHISAVNDALDAFDREAAEVSRGIRGTVRLAIATEAISHGISPVLAAFAAQHPEIRVTLTEMRSGEAEVAVHNGSAEVAVMLRPKSGTRLQTWPYASGRWAVIAPTDHGFAMRAQVTLKNLLATQLIGADRSSALADVLERAASDLGIRIESQVRTSCSEAVVEMVEAGLGVALALDVVAQRAASSHRVVHVPMAEDCEGYELVLAALGQDRLPLATTKVIEWLRLRALETRDVRAGDAEEVGSRVLGLVGGAQDTPRRERIAA